MIDQATVEQVVGITITGLLPLLWFALLWWDIEHYAAQQEEPTPRELSPEEMDTLSQAFVSWETSRCC